LVERDMTSYLRHKKSIDGRRVKVVSIDGGSGRVSVVLRNANYL